MPLPNRRTTRRTGLAVAAGALVTTSLAGPALLSPAASAPVPVTFDDCDLVVDEGAGETRSSAPDLPMTIDVSYPARFAVGTPQTAEYVFSDVPAGIFPRDVTNATVEVYANVIVENNGAPIDSRRLEYVLTRPTFDAGSPFVLGEGELGNTEAGQSGRHVWRLSGFEMIVFGDEGTFRLVCDRAVTPPVAATFGVFDPAAPATVSTTAPTARQGQAIPVAARDFLAEFPDDALTDDLTVLIGGEQAAPLDVDDIGYFTGPVTVPEFARPGAREIVVTGPDGEVARTFLTITAAPGQLTVPARAKSGKALRLTGSAFKPGERVALTVKGGGKTFRKAVVADAAGGFATSVKLKKAKKGAYRVTAAGADSGRKAGGRTRVG